MDDLVAALKESLPALRLQYISKTGVDPGGRWETPADWIKHITTCDSIH